MVVDNVMKYPYTEPTKLDMRKREDSFRAISELHAQINKWCDDNEYLGLRTHSILVNKLMYYTEKEVQKKNEKFKIDTGWYLYGPCYEVGRAYELDLAPVSITLVSEDVSDEVSKVCQELVPLYSKYWQQNRQMGVLRDFLRDIYTQKCDRRQLCEYYAAKHELQCQLWGFEYWASSPKATDHNSVSSAVTQFDKALVTGEYPSFVGLTNEQTDQLQEFGPMLEEYARLYAEGSGSQPLFEAVRSTTDLVLKTLAHLNYANTFEAISPNHTRNVRTTHKETANRKFALLPEENRRLMDAYRPNA